MARNPASGSRPARPEATKNACCRPGRTTVWTRSTRSPRATRWNAGSTQLNTGLFDLNNGLVIANQQGHKATDGFTQSYESNPSAFLNQYPNWTSNTALRGVNYSGFLATLNGETEAVERSAFNEKGRPVLFDREQGANDCFYWTATGSGAAYGSGCLKQRSHSGEILP